MLLTRYGRDVWGPVTIVAVLAIVVTAWLGWWWVIPVLALAWLAVALFFRDPVRRLPGSLDAGDMISPADGVVSAVQRVDHHEVTGGPAQLVRIFLSVLDVHVNWMPCDGRVVSIDHRQGLFYDARTEASARLNESLLVTLAVVGGERVGVRQVVGKVARRIVCGLSVGDEVRRGQRYGMIKFGSTLELILPRPSDVTVAVAAGDRVTGGVTVLATLPPPAGAPAADAAVPAAAEGGG